MKKKSTAFLIINQKQKISAATGISLLTALNEEKIFLPSICGGRGLCGRCRCKVLTDVGSLQPAEQRHLSKEEIQNHVRLACQVTIERDLSIEIPESLIGVDEYEADVSLIKDLTYDIKLLRLRLIHPEEIHFKPGQYVQLKSKPYEGVQDTVYRSYSIGSSSAETGSIDLMIRLVPEGICTTWVHRHLKKGERVVFVGPRGEFCLQSGQADVLMVAGGSGMAPMVSILHEIVDTKKPCKVIYFFGAVTKKDLFYLEEMEEFKKKIPGFTFIPALSQPEPEDDWNGETGLITVPLDKYLKKIAKPNFHVYLCGSPGMINACKNVLSGHGIGNECIFYDPFV
jgi:Na+-transporting NADH:ubiquinone oxidoreductase subunit F